MTGTVPETNLRIVSTVTASGEVRIELDETPPARPGDGQLLLRVEAVPLNPSDLMPMLAGGNPADARFEGSPERPVVTVPLTPQLAQAGAARVGLPLAPGLGGAGTVVAAGKGAEALLGKRVAFLTIAMGALARYCTVALEECVELPDDISAAEGADVFCNPLTALAMVETLRQTGQRAMIHTAAASNLGKMLVRICKEDGIPLVNIVRRGEQAEMLRALGATHICDSSQPGFADELGRAVADTGATVAFDAIGGGVMADRLLTAMEAAAAARMGGFSPYGSQDMKRVYIYGLLDGSPTMLPRAGYGMIWAVEGWAMPPVLARAGAERTGALVQRVVAGLTGTFASDFAQSVSLAGALSRDAMLRYCAKTTGGKYLVIP